MWKILLIVLLSGTAALAQDCSKDAKSDCSDCAKECGDVCVVQVEETSAMTAAVVKLEKGAKKGCVSSAVKLTKLKTTFDVKDCKTLKARLSAYEGYADMGCNASSKQLVAAKTVLDSKVMLSEKVSFMSVWCEKGCDVSAKKVDTLMKECSVKTSKELVVMLQKLETEAQKGNKDSVVRLTALEAKIAPPRPAPLSVRVSKMDKAELTGLLEECGTGCSKSLVAEIQVLEASAARGCKTSTAKLAKLEGALAKPAKDCSDCTDCADCSDCPDSKDCSDKKDCESACPSSKPVETPSG